MSLRRVVCRVCGEGFSPRTLKQDLCSLRCLCRDPQRLVGFPMKVLRAKGKREQTRRAA
jgi:hypothetical protein